MDSAFAWIGNLMEWIGSLVPRWKIVRRTHAGVRFRHGKQTVAMVPGINWYWPAVTEIDVIPVARQTHNLPSQAMLTQDRKQVVVGGVVVFSITDVVAAIGHNWDVIDTIQDITMCAITEVVSTHTLDELLTNLKGEIQEKLTKVTRAKLKRYGVRVFRTYLTDFSTCIVVKNIGGGSTILPQHDLA